MQFVGIYVWTKQLDNEATTRVKSLRLIGWLFVIILCIGLGFLFYYEIPAFAKLLTSQYFFETNFVAHLFDALTNAFSVVGQFLLILCYWEQYILWLAVNIIAIIMYSGLLHTQLDINVLIVWIMFAINTLVGLCLWFRRWKYSDTIVKN
ncbi:hypothetical protein I4U23_018451 [Adineta vaga]|nr:hypothetical protein I4U23_018451 [Adineta vaga]